MSSQSKQCINILEKLICRKQCTSHSKLHIYYKCYKCKICKDYSSLAGSIYKCEICNCALCLIHIIEHFDIIKYKSIGTFKIQKYNCAHFILQFDKDYIKQYSLSKARRFAIHAKDSIKITKRQVDHETEFGIQCLQILKTKNIKQLSRLLYSNCLYAAAFILLIH